MTEQRSGKKMLDFRSGGWLLLLAVVLAVLGALWALRPYRRHRAARPVGDGVHVSSYGFDLSPCLIPPERIRAAGLPKDGLPALDDPPMMTAAEVERRNREERGKYLVPSDRVIGIFLGEEARAYPLRVLNWHEVANDTIGDVPVAVTYNPLSGGVAVFDRRVGGETLTFGISGLLFNSTLLLHERRPEGKGESLWSQLQARAVAGPAAAAGRRLTLLPCTLATWAEWVKEHPGTWVVRPDPAFVKRYARSPYASYRGSDRLRFPVDPLPPPGPLPLKAELLAVGRGEGWEIVPLAEGDGLPAVTRLADPPVTIRRGEPPSVLVRAGVDHPAPILYAYRFAWLATHGGDIPVLITNP